MFCLPANLRGRNHCYRSQHRAGQTSFPLQQECSLICASSTGGACGVPPQPWAPENGEAWRLRRTPTLPPDTSVFWKTAYCKSSPCPRTRQESGTASCSPRTRPHDPHIRCLVNSWLTVLSPLINRNTRLINQTVVKMSPSSRSLSVASPQPSLWTKPLVSAPVRPPFHVTSQTSFSRLVYASL